MSNENESRQLGTENSQGNISESPHDSHEQEDEREKLKLFLKFITAFSAFAGVIIAVFKDIVPDAQKDKLWIPAVCLVVLSFLTLLGSLAMSRIKNSGRKQTKNPSNLLYILLVFLLVFSYGITYRLIPKPDAVLKRVRDIVVTVAAGTGLEEEPRDGAYNKVTLQKPGDLSFDSEGGRLYFVDGGAIRMLENGMVITLNDLPENQLGEFDRKALALQVWENDLYVLSGPCWNADKDTMVVSLLRLRNASLGSCEKIFDCDYSISEGGIATVSDFAVNEDGVYYIQIPESGVATPKLQRVSYDAENDVYDSDDNASETLYRFEEQSEDMINSRMVPDQNGDLLVSVPGKGTIWRIIVDKATAEVKKELLAGESGVLVRNDKGTPTFKMPVSMARTQDGEYLYVMDYGIVRRLSIQDGGVVNCKTLAGFPPEEAAPQEKENYDISRQAPGDKYRFSPYPDVALAVGNGGEVFVSDPELGFIYSVTAVS